MGWLDEVDRKRGNAKFKKVMKRETSQLHAARVAEQEQREKEAQRRAKLKEAELNRRLKEQTLKAKIAKAKKSEREAKPHTIANAFGVGSKSKHRKKNKNRW